MPKNYWWNLTFEIERNFEEIIIWKLTELEVSSYAFNYLKDKENLSQVNIWLPNYKLDKTNRKTFEENFINLFKENGYDKSNFIWDLIEEEHWINSWKKHWKPDPIGKDLLVLPCWMKLPEKYKNKLVLKIDPGAAFGTGSHPSTALCLERMEDISIKDKKVLDIGSGSGILTIAAKILGSNEQCALDNDYLAVSSTRENFKLNFCNNNNLSVYLGSLPFLRNKYSLKNFDIILCNILAEVIKPLIPEMYLALKRGGKIILSGIIQDQKEEIIKVLNFNSFRIDNVSSKQEWISITAIK